MEKYCFNTVTAMRVMLYGVTLMTEEVGSDMRKVLRDHGTEGQIDTYEAMVCVLYWLLEQVETSLLHDV